MADLFKSIIPSILLTKANAFQEDLDYSDYNPFIVNRALSYHLDCILIVNQMNMQSFLDKDMQYFYFINTIRPIKRKFQPWQKALINNDLDHIREFFGFSKQKAAEALKLLSVEQIDIIKEKTNKGGTKNHDKSSGPT